MLRARLNFLFFPSAWAASKGVFYLHVPGTGGSTTATALQYYACRHNLSRSPITRGVKYHGAEDARVPGAGRFVLAKRTRRRMRTAAPTRCPRRYWRRLDAFDVVAAHAPGISVAARWREARAGALVVTTLRDPVTYAAKRALSKRWDLQFQHRAAQRKYGAARAAAATAVWAPTIHVASAAAPQPEPDPTQVPCPRLASRSRSPGVVDARRGEGISTHTL